MLPLRPHLWNAALLLAAASIALAADRLSAAPARRGPVPSGAGGGDVAAFVTPIEFDSLMPRFQMTLSHDPLDARAMTDAESGVASTATVPTVPSSTRGRALTAILIADERRVAVIDDATVKVGDVLRDGARVSSIQPDRVWVVEKNGRWQMLTLTTRGQ